ncbi:MAG TPA: phosphate signaling complex protein PhoU [Williamwhitmania sp.]|nr:phosphate signaling complex protein PhoU [Williamwhitmania sp.]
MSNIAKQNNDSKSNMTHLEAELLHLKKDMIEMWDTVINQVQKAKAVVESGNKDLINEMATGEKLIDAFELKVDMDCENFLALFSPVANDLRLVLAILKINYNLERIGDFAWSTAKVIREMDNPTSSESLEKTNLILMLDTAIWMLKTAMEAFETDDNNLASTIFEKDKILDDNNKNANTLIADLIKLHPENITDFLGMLTIIKKLERIGDHTKNIAEEIIFYIEAKVIRHNRKKSK